MKTKLLILPILFLVFSCKSTKQKDAVQKVYFKINVNKTHADNIGAIMLYFDVINNSKDELIILKPNNTFDHRLNFFSNTMKCEDIPLWSTENMNQDIAVTEKDYLAVEPNSTAELLMNGRAFGWLACNSDSVEISIKYEPKVHETLSEKEYNQVINRISNLKIYSSPLKFKLNK